MSTTTKHVNCNAPTIEPLKKSLRLPPKENVHRIMLYKKIKLWNLESEKLEQRVTLLIVLVF